GCTPGSVIVADAVRFLNVPLGIEGGPPPAAELIIYFSPNPARTSVRIELSGFSAVPEIGIFDISGRLIQKIPALRQQSNVFLWAADDCDPGVYFAAAMSSESGTVSGRIVILER
ncbi:MAG: T9SS type A sorting domain-containing protein, partial [Candidatus Fermentibacteria bacterium]